MNYPPISKLLIFNKFNKIAIFFHRQIHVQYNYKRSFLFSLSLLQLLENLKYSIYICILSPNKEIQASNKNEDQRQTTIPIARYINFTLNFTQSFSSMFQACVTELYKHPFENTSPRSLYRVSRRRRGCVVLAHNVGA